MDFARARQHFLPLHTVGLAAVGCVAQSRACADGGLMPLQGGAPRSPDRRNLEDGGT